jgi:hypothetical protein
MLHHARRFSVVDVDAAEDLAEKLTQHSWCLCAGFRHGGLLFLNDSISEDDAAEFAVLTPTETAGVYEQAESVTFGWMTQAVALAFLREFTASPAISYGRQAVTVQTPEEHGTCEFCA